MKASSQSSGNHLGQAVRKALKDWHAGNKGESPFAQLYLLRKAQRDGHSPMRRATNQVLFQALEALQKTHVPEAKLLQLRFLDLWSIQRLANHYNVAESTIYVMQREAIKQLTEILSELEQLAWSQQQAHLLNRLEAPSNVHLVDVQPHIDHLIGKLTTVDSPWLVAIEGLGGIGKTSLADALVRCVINRGLFDEIGWVSARQSQLNLGGAITEIEQPALTATSLVEALVRQLLPGLATSGRAHSAEWLTSLRARLKQIPHLVVVDNLETLTDLESLLPTLQELANPCKFLLTSRQSLYTTPNIYHFKMPELSANGALRLIRQEAEVSNLPVLAACSDEELRPIYTIVGGNPLALRLVVGQTHTYTLESILHDLQVVRTQAHENLYTFIYRQAWDSLDVNSQAVLLAMPLVNPQGDTLEVIAAISDLDIGTVRMALNRLVMLNLIDGRGGLNDRRYSIHGLTRTFLHTQVIRWQI
jgi:predicted DNA-binding protein YlxM (UPF0122 family)